MNDDDAWLKYKHHHKWFNKLWLSEKLGYVCGPSGVKVPKEGWYIHRPIYNLSGMGIGTERKWLMPHDVDVRPGYFWCEKFEGEHLSIDLEWSYAGPPFWNVVSCYEGIKRDCQRFDMWVKREIEFQLPHFFCELSDVGIINVETIGGNIIEVHLRTSPDPKYDEIIPVFLGEEKNISGYKWIESYEDADKLLDPPRLGFLVR